MRYQAPRDRIARVAHRIVQGAAALGTGRSRSRLLARQRGASAGSAATATDEGDSNYNYNDVELNPMYERFFVQAYDVRADRFKVCAPGHPVWLDLAETSTHDGAYLPWGATVIGQKVTDDRFQDEHGWVCLLHQTPQAETRLWVATRVFDRGH